MRINLNNTPAQTMSKETIYALNVATLAAWITVGIGAVIGFSVDQEWTVAVVKKPQPLSVSTTVDIAPAEAPAGSEQAMASEENAAEGDLMPISHAVTPPPMPQLEEVAELPEIPQMAETVIKPNATRVAAPTKPRQQAQMPSGNRGVAKNAKSGDGPPSTATSLSFGSGAGKQPAPHYPISARRNNHQGTVVVEFIVGTDGRVVNAWIKTPCPYDALNQSALSTIRRSWKFPVGEARRFRIPIVFQLKA
jgi:TonB family protein